MISATSETLIGTTNPDSPVCRAVEPELSQFQIIEKIGQGGMGVVYLAIDRESGRPCALKVIRSDKETDRVSVDRFRFEVQVLEQSSHPNIVRLLDSGVTNTGAQYLAMEFVPGENLDDLVRLEGPLSSHQTVPSLRRICRALGDLHVRGIIHRDIKPANIVASDINGRCDVKLVDFGLAQSVNADSDHAGCCELGVFAGSPLYAAPESHTSGVDARSDIYSLGATAFYLLTGRPVFDEDQPIAAIVAHSGRAPESVKHLQGSVDPLLDAVVMTCLSKNPRDRFQTIDELDEALAKVDEIGSWIDNMESDLDLVQHNS